MSPYKHHLLPLCGIWIIDLFLHAPHTHSCSVKNTLSTHPSDLCHTRYHIPSWSPFQHVHDERRKVSRKLLTQCFFSHKSRRWSRGRSRLIRDSNAVTNLLNNQQYSISDCSFWLYLPLTMFQTKCSISSLHLDATRTVISIHKSVLFIYNTVNMKTLLYRALKIY